VCACSAPHHGVQALERHRKTGGEALKCKQCVQEAEAKERRDAADASAARVRNEPSPAKGGPDKEAEGTTAQRECASCRATLDRTQYNQNQWNKGPDKSRCRGCVDKAVAEESEQASQAKERAIEEARAAVEAAHKSGGPMAVLQAESVLAALEAEKVTGLKPQSMGGRGAGRGRGGRGRGGRGRGGTTR
jgi:Stc1 domain